MLPVSYTHLDVYKRQICYHQRSSDFAQHFGNDIYLAWRLMEYVAHGTEQTVAQVPVTVKARDSERVAVEADGLLPEDRVVVSSSKPIDQGDRVRVLDETA